MKIVHLADIHLGFKQYQRQTPNGLNQREADVAVAFKRAISKIIEIRPDIVLIAGDVFHNVRPSNPAILHAFLEFSRLVHALPDTDVIMIAGNHDSPRSTETGSILRLYGNLGIKVVDDDVQRIPLREGAVQVMAVPKRLNLSLPQLVPAEGEHYNVLLIHGEVEDVVPAYAAGTDRAVLGIKKKDLYLDRWDYVAFGHYHSYLPLAKKAFYSGSLEYTSPDFWAETRASDLGAAKSKGFIEFDLETKEHKFHAIELMRSVVDMPMIHGHGMSAEELNAAIREAVESCDGGIADNIVRLVVRDVPRHVLREIDHKALREFQRKALHFQLDARRPDVMRHQATGSGAPGRRASLADTVREHLRSRAIVAGVDRDSLVDLGLKYLSEAENVAIPAAVTEIA
ncbi:MAG: DNA repair exonuclease [Gemmatimonadaceae bacterium]|nr:DNA repair exonuclease [Gemmatimonadaceae bacterium]